MTASKHRVKISNTDAMLNIRECKHTGVYVEGLRWQRVENLQELLQVTAFINEEEVRVGRLPTKPFETYARTQVRETRCKIERVVVVIV